MEPGKTLDEKKVKEALKKNRMGFESIKIVEIPRPKASYVLKASGTG